MSKDKKIGITFYLTKENSEAIRDYIHELDKQRDDGKRTKFVDVHNHIVKFFFKNGGDETTPNIQKK